MIATEPIDTRLLRLTDEMIRRGVTPTEAANLATKALIEGERANPDPWVTPDEAARLLGLSAKVIARNLLAGDMAYRGAKKFNGQWRIPRSVILPKAA